MTNSIKLMVFFFGLFLMTSCSSEENNDAALNEAEIELRNSKALKKISASGICDGTYLYQDWQGSAEEYLENCNCGAMVDLNNSGTFSVIDVILVVKAFILYDLNNDGIITGQELGSWITAPIPDFDYNEDGVINNLDTQALFNMLFVLASGSENSSFVTLDCEDLACLVGAVKYCQL